MAGVSRSTYANAALTPRTACAMESGYILFANELADVSESVRARARAAGVVRRRGRSRAVRLCGRCAGANRGGASSGSTGSCAAISRRRGIPSRRGDQPGPVADVRRRARARICARRSGDGNGRFSLQYGARARLPVAVLRPGTRAAAAGRLTGYEPGGRGFKSCRGANKSMGCRDAALFYLGGCYRIATCHER